MSSITDLFDKDFDYLCMQIDGMWVDYEKKIDWDSEVVRSEFLALYPKLVDSVKNRLEEKLQEKLESK